eukprot:Lankesteria_metandrocarpae@DN3393_c0_g1_i2.p1
MVEVAVGELRLAQLSELVGTPLDECKTIKLHSMGISSLADLKEVKELRAVDLTDNRIDTLHWFQWNLRLTSLSLSKNLVSTICTDLSKLDNLVVLNLSYNKLTSSIIPFKMRRNLINWHHC